MKAEAWVRSTGPGEEKRAWAGVRVESIRGGLAEGEEQKRKMVERWVHRTYRKPCYGLFSPKLPELHLTGWPLFSFHPLCHARWVSNR